MTKPLTLNRNLRAHWLVEALRLRATQVDPEEATSRLEWMISQDIQGKESIRKSLRYLRQVWLEEHPQFADLQEQGCSLYRTNPQDALSKQLSFFMLMAIFPFAREVAEACGQLFRLQGSLKTEQIKRKIVARYGDREPIVRSTRYAVSIFNDLGLLQKGESRGVYSSPAFQITHKQFSPYALAALFHSEGKRHLSRKELETHPALYAYNIHQIIENALSSPAFILSRESLTREIVNFNC